MGNCSKCSANCGSKLILNEKNYIPNRTVDYSKYHVVIVAFSGGKDSIACFLNLLKTGCPIEKIELWHHDIDADRPFMDWPITRDYCRAFAAAFGVKIYFSYKNGGFLGEMLRKNQATASVSFEAPKADGTIEILTAGGESKKFNTRHMFPQKSADLNERWCSAYLKIDVAAKAIIHQPRFLGKKVLFITGERAEESVGRAAYAVKEYHKTDAGSGDASKLIRNKKIQSVLKKLVKLNASEISLDDFNKNGKPQARFPGFSAKEKTILSDVVLKEKETISSSDCEKMIVEKQEEFVALSKKALASFKKRTQKAEKGQGLFRKVHAWRPVHKWTTAQIWSIIEEFKINPHTCYKLGWGRCSCAGCVFGDKDQWASLKVVLPEVFARILAYEKSFGKTIDSTKVKGVRRNIEELAAEGTPYPYITPEFIKEVASKTWDQPIIMETWVRPAGATGKLVGPC
jgi:3'-phosphoadenosine 5'-phosphosulfate sulfotransferase (PAPS reductase)/FAD synthetase